MHEPFSLWIGAAEATPLGEIWLGATRRGLAAVEIGADPEQFSTTLARRFGSPAIFEPDRIAAAAGQITAYLTGKRTAFDLKIDWGGLRPFQRTVLQEVFQIPYGQVTTYGAIAKRIGKPQAYRAVGRANGSNPVALVIPCHRVIGQDGKLHGYGAPGGLETKAWLLELERSTLSKESMLQQP